MRTTTVLFLSLSACAPVDATVPDGDWALSFTGDGCGEYTGDPDNDDDEYQLSGELTLEAWLQVAADADDDQMAVVQLGNAGVLWVGAVGAGLSPPSNWDEGATTGVDLDDAAVHHLAAVVSPDEGAEIYLDGIRVGFGEDWGVVPGADSVYLGCDATGGGNLRGVVDEVRISDTVRYTSNFEVPDGPFEGDSDTIALYHLDLGLGSAALDEAARFDLELSDSVTWAAGLTTP